VIASIRYAEPAERGALGDLHRRSSYVWPEDRAMLEAHPDALGIAPEAIASRRVRVAVGEGGELLGFAVVADGGGDVCELDDLFVDPEAMRQGVGRALVEDAADTAFAGGYREMTVVAHPRKFPFYRSVGFVPGEAAQTRFGPAVRMRRKRARVDQPS
jgi:GNAT superfamily N-acetyltransferase